MAASFTACSVVQGILPWTMLIQCCERGLRKVGGRRRMGGGGERVYVQCHSRPKKGIY